MEFLWLFNGACANPFSVSLKRQLLNFSGRLYELDFVSGSLELNELKYPK